MLSRHNIVLYLCAVLVFVLGSLNISLSARWLLLLYSLSSDNVINTIGSMSTGPSFPHESVQILLFDEYAGWTQKKSGFRMSLRALRSVT